jgi:glycosyltransferase involved in cell wall biosynthesis
MVTTPSEFIKRQFLPDVRHKTHVTHWGSDHYTPPPDLEERAGKLRQELGVEGEGALLLYVGRLNPVYQRYKGVSELEDHFESVMRKYPGTKALMVGLGEDSDKERLAAKGIDCMILPPAEQMPEIYAACDIFTTCTHWEGFDLPLLEAQAFHKPVVAYRRGAHGEVAKDNLTGYLVNNPHDFQARLRRLVRRREARREMGRQAGIWAEHFTWGMVGETYDELIGSVIR